MIIPVNNGSRLEEVTGRSVIRNQRLANRLGCSFLNGLDTAIAVYISSRMSSRVVPVIPISRGIARPVGRVNPYTDAVSLAHDMSGGVSR